jgi:hypothetical protein
MNFPFKLVTAVDFLFVHRISFPVFYRKMHAIHGFSLIVVLARLIKILFVISGDKDRFSFPPEMPTVHAEFTYFYYPGDFVFPRKYCITSERSSSLTKPFILF